MKNRFAVAAVSTLLLTGCALPSWLGLSWGSAQIHLTLTELHHLKTVSAYRTLQADTEVGPQVTVNDFTPESFRAPIEFIALIGEDDRQHRIYEGKEPLEFVNQRALEATLNADGLKVPAGTYKGLWVRLGEPLIVKGSAKVGDLTVYTKASADADATQGPAEDMVAKQARDRELTFSKPLTIGSGEAVKLSLVYDLTDSLFMKRPGQASETSESDLEKNTLLAKNIPFFAFIGEPPKPEIYEVRFKNSDTVMLDSDERWHYRLILFTADNGDLLGVQSVIRLEDGYIGGGISNLNFTNNKLDEHGRNPDGTYRFMGYKESGTDIPTWQVNAFKRESHSGKATYYHHGYTPSPVEVEYQAVKVE